jgi:hypothetical protein
MVQRTVDFFSEHQRSTDTLAGFSSGSVALSLCTTAHPIHTRFSNIFGISISESAMPPNPRFAGGVQKMQEYLGRHMGATAAEVQVALQRAGLLPAAGGHVASPDESARRTAAAALAMGRRVIKCPSSIGTCSKIYTIIAVIEHVPMEVGT